MAGMVNTETGLPTPPVKDAIWSVVPPEQPKGWTVYADGRITDSTGKSVRLHSELRLVQVEEAGPWSDWQRDRGLESSWYRANLGYEPETRRISTPKKFLGLFPYTDTYQEIRVRKKEYRAILGFEPLPAKFTEEDIRKAAELITDQIVTTVKRESLYGDYPPKKLGN